MENVFWRDTALYLSLSLFIPKRFFLCLSISLYPNENPLQSCLIPWLITYLLQYLVSVGI